MNRPGIQALLTPRVLSVLLIALAFLITGAILANCGDDDDPAPSATTPGIADFTGIPWPDDLGEGLQLPPDVEPVDFPYTETTLVREMGEVPIGILVANTFERRTRGLMYWTSIREDTGMLFAFPADTSGPFWADNTPIDLDIAFASADGVIREIRQLIAFDQTLVAPDTPYRYALEVPAGWFEVHGVTVGTRIVIPEGLQAEGE